MFYELAQLAIGNLSRASARFMMTAGGVVVGTTAVILLIALTIGLQTAAEAGLGSNAALTEIQVYANGDPSNPKTPQLNDEAVRVFWQIPGVAAVVPAINLQSGQLIAGNLTGFSQILGVDERLLPYLGVKLAKGEFALGTNQVVIGARAGDYFTDPKNMEEGGEFQPTPVDLYTTPFRIELIQYTSQTPSKRRLDVKATGLLQPGMYENTIFMALSDVMRHNEWMSGQKYDPRKFRYDNIIVRASHRETTNSVTAAIRKMGFGAGGMGEFLDQLNGFFGMMRLMFGGVGGVALLVAAFGVANTMTMAILERTKEIGLMKAIGARDRDILTVFLIEAGMVGLMGGLAGAGLSLVLQNIINQAIQKMPQSAGGMSFLPLDPSKIGGNLMIIPPQLYIFAIALAALVGLSAGLYPALRAARLPPVIALKQE